MTQTNANVMQGLRGLFISASFVAVTGFAASAGAQVDEETPVTGDQTINNNPEGGSADANASVGDVEGGAAEQDQQQDQGQRQSAVNEGNSTRIDTDNEYSSISMGDPGVPVGVDVDGCVVGGSDGFSIQAFIPFSGGFGIGNNDTEFEYIEECSDQVMKEIRMRLQGQAEYQDQEHTMEMFVHYQDDDGVNRAMALEAAANQIPGLKEALLDIVEARGLMREEDRNPDQARTWDYLEKTNEDEVQQRRNSREEANNSASREFRSASNDAGENDEENNPTEDTSRERDANADNARQQGNACGPHETQNHRNRGPDCLNHK